jgi:hypothetical protein
MTAGIAGYTMFRVGIPALVHRPETIDYTMQLGCPIYFVVSVGTRPLLDSLGAMALAISLPVCRGASWHVVVTLGFAALALAA